MGKGRDRLLEIETCGELSRPSRRSRLSCTNGKVAAPCVAAPCSGVTSHASCDSAPGSGDGLCDACATTAGVSTEDEMFISIGSYAFGDVE